EALVADAAAPSDGESDYERQIDQAIEDAGIPAAGEQVEPVAPVDEHPADAEARAAEEPATLAGAERWSAAVNEPEPPAAAEPIEAAEPDIAPEPPAMAEPADLAEPPAHLAESPATPVDTVVPE